LLLHILNHVFTIAVGHFAERLWVSVAFAVLLLDFNPKSVLDADVLWHQLRGYLIEYQL